MIVILIMELAYWKNDIIIKYKKDKNNVRRHQAYEGSKKE